MADLDNKVADSLPVLPPLVTDHEQFNEKDVARKSSTDSGDIVGEKDIHSEGDSQLESKSDHNDGVRYVNGEPVIANGRDVSQYLVDVRDDGDASLTFRSLFLGTIFAGLGASLYQVRFALSQGHDIS